MSSPVSEQVPQTFRHDYVPHRLWFASIHIHTFVYIYVCIHVCVCKFRHVYIDVLVSTRFLCGPLPPAVWRCCWLQELLLI